MQVNFADAETAVLPNHGATRVKPDLIAIRSEENNEVLAVSRDEAFLKMLQRANIVEAYIKNACRTESLIGTLETVNSEPYSEVNSRILHAVLGLVSESGEFANQLKRHIFYKKELDLVNLKEEAGDILWYLAILFDSLGITFAEVMDLNIKKLTARYPDKFSAAEAVNRDLENERKILENG